MWEYIKLVFWGDLKRSAGLGLMLMILVSRRECGGEVAMLRRYPDSHANAGGLQDARYPFVNLPSTRYHWWFMKAIWEY